MEETAKQYIQLCRQIQVNLRANEQQRRKREEESASTFIQFVRIEDPDTECTPHYPLNTLTQIVVKGIHVTGQVPFHNEVVVLYWRKDNVPIPKLQNLLDSPFSVFNMVGQNNSLNPGLSHVHFKRMQDMSKDGLIPAFDMDTEKWNKKYFVTFIDDASEFCYVYLLHLKDEALDKFKVFKTEVELQQGFLIKRFRTDRGGEYMDTLYFQSVGIIHETTAPYTLQQNGISERKNKVLKEMVNSMLSYSGLSQGVVVRLPNPKLETFGERGIKCIFVGYAEHFKDFKFYVIEPNDPVAINSIIESSDAIFDEHRFSSVSIPSQRSMVKGTEDSGGSVVPEKVTEEVHGIRPLGCKWIFKRKLKVDGTVEKVKASLSDYSSDGCEDSFLNGELDKEVYMNQPQGFIMLGNENKVDLTKEFLSSRFSMKDMGEADVILGIRIKHESNGIAISQSHYIEKVLKKFNYFDCTPMSTPMDTSEKLRPNKDQVVSQLKYSRVIGCLMYAMTSTRPDIAFAVGKLSRLMYIGYPSVLEGYTNASWISNTEEVTFFNFSISSLAMSSASFAVTYTFVYTYSEPGRVFWGADEEISDGGSPRVIILGYDGLPIQPVAPPSPDYIPGPEDPQTPPVPYDEDEREPMFIHPHDPDYMPEPIYPEYISLEDEHEFLAEEQSLPPVVSPTAESPGYVVESDPEEDPEEYEDDETKDGPVDYPIDEGEDGDDDDGNSSEDDADDEDEDEEDEDEEEEEEEEHLAPIDSSVIVPTVELVSPPEGTEPVIPPPFTDITTTGARITVRLQASISLPPNAEVERLLAMPTPPSSLLISVSPPSAGERLTRCTAPFAHSSPPPVLSPLLPSSGCPTQIQTLRIASTQSLVDAVTAALPSPPLPPLPPSLYIPPPVDRRDDIPDSEWPPRKRSCLFALC
ncbi:zinc finger, CCHC-type containing protein [Tanacetum coccineum]